MRVLDIIKMLSDVELFGDPDTEILDITEHSASANTGAVFVCIKGSRDDGAAHLAEARLRGSSVFVCESKVNILKGETLIFSKNARKTSAEISKILYGNCTEFMKVIGITGTKGKTTTAKLLSDCISWLRIPHLLIGTLGIDFYEKEHTSLSSDNTTPDAPHLYRALRDAFEKGIRIAVIEVSSQALSNFRVFGLPFFAVVFTNFSPDHIGPSEHNDVDEYYQAKKSLFSDYGAEVAVVNSSDDLSMKISEGVKRVFAVSCDLSSDFCIRIGEKSKFGITFTVNGIHFELPMGGVFNALNAAVAVACASVCFDRPTETFVTPLSRSLIPGRYELYSYCKRMIVIDFAHNEESFRSICESVKFEFGGRIIAVFGSVGERSFERRESLARVAEELADLSVITSDNPGFEEAEKICDDILFYFCDKSRAVVIVDREEAIKRALAYSHEGDCILLLGKGHEEFQDIKGQRIPFSERKIIEDLGARKLIR